MATKKPKAIKEEKTVPVEMVQEIADQAATEQANKAPDAPVDQAGQVQVNVDFLRTTKVHIAMPCYGGMLTESCFMSYIKWANACRQLGIDWTMETMTNEGYRVLGVGVADFSGTEFPKTQQEFKFSFKGLIAFYDPPKKNIQQVFETFYKFKST